jgi:hypothetical protein
VKNKPPQDSITKTADLMRRLLAVPKSELEAQERKWKKRRPQVTKGRSRST